MSTRSTRHRSPTRHRRRHSAVLAACAAIAAPAAALDLDGAALAKLKAGEPVFAISSDAGETASGRIEAVIDIPAPPAAIWRILTDCDVAVKVMGGLKACKVLARDPAGAFDSREHTIAWSRFLPSVRNVFRSDYVPEREIRFARTDGDLKRLEGAWRLEPQPDGGITRLTYTASIALGVPLPSALVRSALESDMPKTLAAIRKAAMQGVGG